MLYQVNTTVMRQVDRKYLRKETKVVWQEDPAILPHKDAHAFSILQEELEFYDDLSPDESVIKIQTQYRAEVIFFEEGEPDNILEITYIEVVL